MEFIPSSTTFMAFLRQLEICKKYNEVSLQIYYLGTPYENFNEDIKN